MNWACGECIVHHLASLASVIRQANQPLGINIWPGVSVDLTSEILELVLILCLMTTFSIISIHYHTVFHIFVVFVII